METDHPITLLHWLTREFPRGKRETFKQMLTHGRIRINGMAAVKLSQPLRPKDDVRILARDQVRQGPLPSLHPIKLVHEDADLLIIDKPAGLLTSTVAGERRPTALAIIRQYVAARDPGAPVGLIHRLDRDASGVLVFSKSHRAYKSLKSQFFKHTVERIYEALVEGVPNPRSGSIDTRLVERADGTVRSTDHPTDGQRAVTEFEVVETLKVPPHAGAKRSGTPRSAAPGRSTPSNQKTSRVRIKLLTGRKHQIRVHLAERGHPIVGDQVYGSTRPGPLQLRAVRLVIDHPATGKRAAFESTGEITD